MHRPTARHALSAAAAAAAAAAALCGTWLPLPAQGQPAPADAAAPRRERPPIVVAPDRRIPIVPSPEARAQVLADMREYLSGLQSMFTSLSRQDPQGAARTARALAALTTVEDVPLATPSPFEDDFRELGSRVRSDFARIADAAGRRPDARQTMGRLGIALQTCVACHQTFQLNEVFAAPARQRSREEAVEAGEGGTAAHPDPRIPLLARPNARAYLLRSMRLYLAGLQTTLVALSQDDWATVADTARAMEQIDVRDVALSSAHGSDARLHELARDVHRRFGAVAEGARARDTGRTLGEIGEAMRTCVECHRTYRLEDSARPRAVPARR